MKNLLILLIALAVMIGCENGKNTFDISEEPLSVEAQAKVMGWVGYKTFSFELTEMASNYSKEYLQSNMKSLVSASNSVLYSIPNDLRTEAMNKKANSVVELTKGLNQSVLSASEDSMENDFAKLIEAYNKLNNEINYQVRN